MWHTGEWGERQNVITEQKRAVRQTWLNNPYQLNVFSEHQCVFKIRCMSMCVAVR